MDDLWEECQKQWMEILKKSIQHLYHSIPSRLNYVIRNKRMNTPLLEYFLLCVTSLYCCLNIMTNFGCLFITHKSHINLLMYSFKSVRVIRTRVVFIIRIFISHKLNFLLLEACSRNFSSEQNPINSGNFDSTTSTKNCINVQLLSTLLVSVS